jgi:type IV secretory pathway TrbL component
MRWERSDKVFYFQQLFSQGLSGINGTAIIPTITTIAYTILLIGFMTALYQAAMRGGDVQSLGIAAIKYVVVAIILANWNTVFTDINNSFNQLAQYIASTSSSGDMFSSWLSQLKQQFLSGGLSSFWKLIIGSAAALITAVLIVAAYLIFAVAVVIFGFFYTLYGCVLYVVGPLVLALLPIVGVGRLGANFATNLLIWNSWGVLYAIFGALITAIHVNDVNTLFSNGFGGFFVGTVDSLVLGIVSIFYAVSLMLIPKIAKSIISGEVGVTVLTLARAGAAAAGTAISVFSGAAAGGASASAAGAGASAASGAGAGASSGGGAAGGGAVSSSMPPPQPGLAGTITSAMKSVVGGGTAPSSSASQQQPSSDGGSSSAATSSAATSAASGADQGSSAMRPQPFNRGSVVQTAAFHTARLASQAVRGTLGGNDQDKDGNAQ